MGQAFEPDNCQPLEEAVKRGEVSLTARARGQYPGMRLREGQLPGLRSVGYWDAVGPQTWGLPMHRNEGIEICYLLSGETAFATDREQWMLRPGDITITRPWQRHRLGDPNIRACRLFWTILDVESGSGRSGWEFPSWIGPDSDSRRELLRMFRKNQRCHVFDEGHPLKEFLLHACERLPEKSPLLTADLADLINHLLLRVARILSQEMPDPHGDPHGYNATIHQFFQGLESSLETAAEPWTVAEIARSCRVGVTYLTAACKEMFNTTPSEQLNRIRLAHAAEQLRRHPKRSVTDIAFATGFNSSQYFATRFRKQYGKTPQVYRAS